MVKIINPPIHLTDLNSNLEIEITSRTKEWEANGEHHELQYITWEPVKGSEGKPSRRRHRAGGHNFSDVKPGMLHLPVAPSGCRVAVVGKGEKRGKLVWSDKRPICPCDFPSCRQGLMEQQRARILTEELEKFFESDQVTNQPLPSYHTIGANLPTFQIPVAAIGIEGRGRD
jgi:hypothetical protein